ncbi:hypothetical protein [Bradyrhizobium sp. STM 3809]|uniref:hypothetical protein n=1 Tax=Bradyrhizobium sp. STM 3809 TaxID=551936 RepID=UPI001112BDB2|nr:hypothetical protein [Bradyrhizobium sp. STM 3809]
MTGVLIGVGGCAMRQRLQRFFPIFLIALTVQIFVPIGSVLAAAIAAADQAWSAEICHHNSDSRPPHGDDGSGGCDVSCPLCYAAAQADAWGNPPRWMLVAEQRNICTSVRWSEQVSSGLASHHETHGQARAPPAAA